MSERDHRGRCGVADGVRSSFGRGCACASRECIGRRKMSRNAAASGARHAHAVICSASFARWLSKTEKKIVPRTATPTEFDSCWVSTIKPESHPTTTN
jgi:hypothetical protein